MKVYTCPQCQGLIELTGVVSNIRQFHENFDIAYDGPPRLLPKDIQQFRTEFMKEELMEYEVAVEERDAEKQLDALVDLVYVALGTAYVCGWNFEEAWRRVHHANMQKVRASKENHSDRHPTFDIVKPPGWVAPTHHDLVEGSK